MAFDKSLFDNHSLDKSSWIRKVLFQSIKRQGQVIAND
jgi:hypothetical protein